MFWCLLTHLRYNAGTFLTRIWVSRKVGGRGWEGRGEEGGEREKPLFAIKICRTGLDTALAAGWDGEF